MRAHQMRCTSCAIPHNIYAIWSHLLDYIFLNRFYNAVHHDQRQTTIISCEWSANKVHHVGSNWKKRRWSDASIYKLNNKLCSAEKRTFIWYAVSRRRHNITVNSNQTHKANNPLTQMPRATNLKLQTHRERKNVQINPKWTVLCDSIAK